MALIKCPECAKDVSNKAHFCPNCGDPIKINRAEEREDASILLAEKAVDASTLLAEKTQESAELLAITTKKAAQDLSKSKEISVKWMRLMTITLVVVGFIQIVIATVAMFISLRQK
jgi:predicted amidophosphoribosyltransferase